MTFSNTDGHTGIGWPAKAYIHQLCADTGYHLEDLLNAMIDRDGWWEGESRASMLSAHFDDDDDDDEDDDENY